MGSPTSAKAIALAVLLAAAGGAMWWNSAVKHAPLQPATTVTTTTAPRPAEASANDQAASEPAETSGRIAQGPAIEAPPVEVPEASAPSGESGSFGRRAGLNKVKDDLHLSSSAAMVVDRSTGEVLFRKNEEAVLPIASLTKIMTALILSESKLPLGEVITITEDDVDGERHSRSRLRVGTSLTRSEALRVALMSSENRAAHALGRTFPGGLDNFVRAMNRKAKLLGMQNTAFVDPTGLSSRNQSTARDVSTLAAVAARNPLLAEYTTTREHLLAVAGGRTVRYRNSNRLVKNPQWDISLQKTGYIIEAGWCMVMDAKIAGQDLLIVLLDAQGNSSRLADAERIKRWIGMKAGLVSADATAVARPTGLKSRQGEVRTSRSRSKRVRESPAARPSARQVSPRRPAEKCRSQRSPCRPARSAGNAG